MKGALKAVLTGVPKPQVSFPETWEKAQPQGCLDCVETLEPRLEIKILIK